MTGGSFFNIFFILFPMLFLLPLPSVAKPAFFMRDFHTTWAESHVKLLNNGAAIQLSLDPSSGARFSLCLYLVFVISEYTEWWEYNLALFEKGCGFASNNKFMFGHVSMKIKLVPGDSAGTVTAFYLNSAIEAIRDELDFEFLGNRSGQPYTVQTNVYAHGKGDREQRVNLWFDPSADFHTYSIFWNRQHIV